MGTGIEASGNERDRGVVVSRALGWGTRHRGGGERGRMESKNRSGNLDGVGPDFSKCSYMISDMIGTSPVSNY